MRKRRIPGTPAARDMRRPVCAKGHTDIIKIHGDWFCVECKPVQVKQRRVVLPDGVTDPDTLSVRDIFPNRAARRAARAHRSNA